MSEQLDNQETSNSVEDRSMKARAKFGITWKRLLNEDVNCFLALVQWERGIETRQRVDGLQHSNLKTSIADNTT